MLTKFFLDNLRKSKGCVINITGDKGSRPEPGQLGYCMSKAGLDMMTKSLAMELAPFGVRVNAVAPSFVDTNLYRYGSLNADDYEALKKRAANNIPLGRIGIDQDVAKAVIFLTSEQALKITGHIMKVDGGRSLTSRGQIDWYGHPFMTRKFENSDSTSYLNFKLSKNDKVRAPPAKNSSAAAIEDYVE